MREETKILDCGCKIGRSKGGIWFYDYLCEIHVGEVYDESGEYSIEKAEELTRRMNEIMKLPKKRIDLSPTEQKAYDAIAKVGEDGLPIMELSHQLQGAVGKLKSKGLIEIFRKRHTWTYAREWDGRKITKRKMTNWVRIKK